MIHNNYTQIAMPYYKHQIIAYDCNYIKPYIIIDQRNNLKPVIQKVVKLNQRGISPNNIPNHLSQNNFKSNTVVNKKNKLRFPTKNDPILYENENQVFLQNNYTNEYWQPMNQFPNLNLAQYNYIEKTALSTNINGNINNLSNQINICSNLNKKDFNNKIINMQSFSNNNNHQKNIDNSLSARSNYLNNNPNILNKNTFQKQIESGNYNNSNYNDNNYISNYNNNNYNNNNYQNYNYNNHSNNNNYNYKNNYNNNNYNNNNTNNNYLNNDHDNNCNPKIEINSKTKPKGLLNVGATCYMNATLQCFYHIKSLSCQLLKDYCISFKEMPVTFSFKDLVIKLSDQNYRDEYNSVKPELFKLVISRKSLLFAGIRANDSKDLILFMLNSMDDELSERNKKFNINNHSIIADLFNFNQRCCMICCNCHHKTDNIQLMNFLIFPLEHIYNNTKKNNTFKNKLSLEKPSVTLENCFENLQQKEKLTGDNQILCESCGQMCDAISVDIICSTPKILILILNRGKGNSFDCDVKFEYNLNIDKFNENRTESSNTYNLIGVISHIGESSMNGHFLAFCKHFDGKWYCFNDGMVSKLGSMNDIYSGIPYILFYQKETEF